MIAYEGIEEKLYELMKEYEICDRIIISSFNHESVLRMKEIDSTLKLGFLEESVLANPVKYLKDNGIFYFHPLVNTVDKDLVSNLHDEGIFVNAWLSSKLSYNLEDFVEMGFDGLITDFPDRVDELLKK